MSKKETLKGVIGFTAAIGAGLIVGNLVTVSTPLTTRFLPRVAIKVGALALGGALGEAAGNFTDRTIDEIADSMKKIFGIVDEIKEQVDLATPKGETIIHHENGSADGEKS